MPGETAQPQGPEGQPAPQPAAEKPQPAKKAPSRGRVFLRSLLIGILLLVIGAAAIFFPLYLPLSRDAGGLRSERDTLAQRATQVEGTLSVVQTQLSGLQGRSTSLQALSSLYKLQSDVSIARMALANKDSNSAAQALTYASTDLEALAPFVQETTVLNGLRSRLSSASSAVQTNPDRAETELATFVQNLLLLENRFQPTPAP